MTDLARRFFLEEFDHRNRHLENTGDPVERFRVARRDPGLVVLEGFHPIKHALRFGARLLELVTEDMDRLAALAAALAPELAGTLTGHARTVPPEEFRHLSPHPPSTGVLGIAARPPADVGAALADPHDSPIVFLEKPSNLGNLGAAIRVAAAAGARATLTSGINDPWHPAAVRGSAGLHFALCVERIQEIPHTDRPILALHPTGKDLEPGCIPSRAILVFGSERHGLDPATLARVQSRTRIPMRSGVSSLNLATAVAVALYSIRPPPPATAGQP